MKTGKISENVLKRSVLGQIKTERKEVLNGAGLGEDCAIFSFFDRYTVSSMREAAVRLKTDVEAVKLDIEPRVTMGHLMQSCANNLAAAGAEPVALMISLLLPETVSESDLKSFMKEAEEMSGELSMSIAGGQTRVSGEVKTPIAVVTGFGTLPLVRGNMGHIARNVSPGQDVIVSKWIGLEGTAMLARRYRERLLSRYPSHLVEEAASFDRYLSVLPESAAAVAAGVRAMHDVSEGGIFAALWELAEAAGVGLAIDIRKLPLRQETVEVCEYCNVNPYELLSGGSLLMTAEDGAGLVAALKKQQIPAVIVGKVEAGKARLLLNGEEVRYMDRPKRDELYRVFRES